MSNAAEWQEFVAAATPPPLERVERFRLLGKCEVLFGLTATFFLGFAPVVVLVMVSVFSFFLGEWVLFSPVILPAIAATAAAVWVARAAGRAGAVCYPELGWGRDTASPPRTISRKGPPPYAVELGLQVATLHWLVRPVLSLWWCAHFAAGFWLVSATHHWIADAFDRPGTMVLVLFPLLVHLAFNVAANLYLILSVAALHADEWLLRRLWSARFLIDVAVTLSALAVVH
jgi:hypothetical protein